MTTLSPLDIAVLLLYALVLIAMGIYFLRRTRTADDFMVAGRTLPAWAAGLAVMSAYTSSISYIAVPGKAFDSNWHPLIFALTIPPVAWLVCRWVVPYYRRTQLISVYSFLEDRLGPWARVYAAVSFVVYMIGRAAVILYLASLLLCTFVPWDIRWVILVIGLVTIVYTLLGGMEAVVWTDVMQSVIMVGGLLFMVGAIAKYLLAAPEGIVAQAVEAGKFSLGPTDWSFTSRTIWVMVIYGVTENLRNLMADQNYVQKYCAVRDERDAKRSIFISMAIYIPMTALLLFIGSGLWLMVHSGGMIPPDNITKGDQMLPYYIATALPIGIRGLVIAAILAAAMSTVDSALNCSATVIFLDFFKRFINPKATEQTGVRFLRAATILWGVFSVVFALLMIRAKSALDTWWQISGIFGGGILGLFLLSLAKVKLKTAPAIAALTASILTIAWITLARDLPDQYQWAQCNLDPILAGAVGLTVLLVFGLLLSRIKASQSNTNSNPATGRKN